MSQQFWRIADHPNDRCRDEAVPDGIAINEAIANGAEYFAVGYSTDNMEVRNSTSVLVGSDRPLLPDDATEFLLNPDYQPEERTAMCVFDDDGHLTIIGCKLVYATGLD